MEKTTDYQAKYFAYALTREGGQGIERLQQSLLNATVDLNPHQIQIVCIDRKLSKEIWLDVKCRLMKDRQQLEKEMLKCQNSNT